MFEHEGNGLRVEPGIERVEYRADHGRTKMHVHHRRNIRQHCRNGVTFADAAFFQRRRQLAATQILVFPGSALCAMHHRDPMRIDVGRFIQKRQRRERRKVRAVLIQMGIVGMAHDRLPAFNGLTSLNCTAR